MRIELTELDVLANTWENSDENAVLNIVLHLQSKVDIRLIIYFLYIDLVYRPCC